MPGFFYLIVDWWEGSYYNASYELTNITGQTMDYAIEVLKKELFKLEIGLKVAKNSAVKEYIKDVELKIEAVKRALWMITE